MKWSQRYRATGSVTPGKVGGHRKPVLNAHRSFIRERIDQIAATLGGTQQWIRDQRSILGPLDEMLTEPPPLMTGAAREAE